VSHASPIRARRKIDRLLPAHVAPFSDIQTGFLVDALGRTGALHHRIKPVWSSPFFAGSALTVAVPPKDNLAIYAAMRIAQPGDVLVIATGAYEGAALFGDYMAGLMKNCGIVAVVTDGMVRDVSGIAQVGLPVYARGVTPNSPFKNGPGEIGFPIALDGVPVRSGDLMLGDADGVVVCPRERLAQVLPALQAIHTNEADMDRAVREGLKTPKWLDELFDAAGVTFVD